MPKTNLTYPITLHFLFQIIISSFAHSRNECPNSFCHKNKNLPIHYPFHLEGHNKRFENCHDPPFNLKCSDQSGFPLLNLPSSGDFFVRSINYSSRTLQLGDPNGCLIGRLMIKNLNDFSAYGVPLAPAVGYRNYTFFGCRREDLLPVDAAVECLSNETFSTVAILSADVRDGELRSTKGCSLVAADRPIPVSSGDVFHSDLPLTWNVPRCDVCEGKKHRPGVKGLLFWLLGFPIIVGAVSFILAYAMQCYDKTTQAAARARQASHAAFGHQLASTTAAVNPPPIARQANTVVVGESRLVAGPNSSSCPICLEDYSPRENIRFIPSCQHCFHAKCIDEWLRNHSSCPICRNSSAQ